MDWDTLRCFVAHTKKYTRSMYAAVDMKSDYTVAVLDYGCSTVNSILAYRSRRV